MKTTFSLTLLIFLSNTIYSQENSFPYEKRIESLIIKLNGLPKTCAWGMPNNKCQSKYIFKLRKNKTSLIIDDIRLEPQRDIKKIDSYKSFINISDLHCDGVILKYNSDSSRVSLMLYTAKNYQRIKNKSFINNSYHSKQYSDRIHFGSWHTKSVLNELKDISQLFSLCINDKTNWAMNDRPDINCILPIKTPKNATVISHSYDIPPYLNISLKNPSLFPNAKSVDDNKNLIKEYVLRKLKSKGIKYKGMITGSIIINASGEVENFESANKNKPHLEKLVKEIILTMPKWKPATLRNENVKVSQLIVI